jgi:hypothetical protein
METRPFGVDEFQLVLLRRMADFHPDLVEQARGTLGASATDMRDVNAHWQRFVRSRTAPRGAARYASALGPPISVGEQRTGAIALRLHRWELPLWPDLRFEVVEGPGGTVLQEWLVRAPDAKPPAASTGADLHPWRYVVGDLELLFTGVRHLPSDAPSRWASQFTAAGVRHRARFVWGLLQEVSALDDAPRA